METSPEAIFSSMRQQLTNQNFSTKSIKKEKKRLVDKRRKKWASLGGQALHLLAKRYAQNQNATKSSIAQIAYFAHRLITILPGFVLSPIAGVLGGLKAQITSSDAKIVGSLRQKHLLNTLCRLNKKIEELYWPNVELCKQKGLCTGNKNYKISPEIYEDFKAILAYAKNFDEIHYEKLRSQIDCFEKFVAMINHPQERNFKSALKVPVFVDPHGDEEI